MSEVPWDKLIPAAIALTVGGGVGTLGGATYNAAEHRIRVEATQALLDSNDAAHQHAMELAQKGYRDSLEIISRSCLR